MVPVLVFRFFDTGALGRWVPSQRLNLPLRWGVLVRGQDFGVSLDWETGSRDAAYGNELDDTRLTSLKT